MFFLKVRILLPHKHSSTLKHYRTIAHWSHWVLGQDPKSALASWRSSLVVRGILLCPSRWANGASWKCENHGKTLERHVWNDIEMENKNNTIRWYQLISWCILSISLNSTIPFRGTRDARRMPQWSWSDSMVQGTNGPLVSLGLNGDLPPKNIKKCHLDGENDTIWY